MSVMEGFEESLKSLCKQFTKNEDKYDLVLAEENYLQFQNLLKRNGMTYIVRHSESILFTCTTHDSIPIIILV